jgi:hypothetical protein
MRLLKYLRLLPPGFIQPNQQSNSHSQQSDDASVSPGLAGESSTAVPTAVPTLPVESHNLDEENPPTDEEDYDSDATLPYEDLYILEDDQHWSMLTSDAKSCAATGSFTIPRDL